jgi:hypothetical protein
MRVDGCGYISLSVGAADLPIGAQRERLAGQ